MVSYEVNISPKALSQLGDYLAISFSRHSYVMLYRIENTVVFVDAIYHQRQDYENAFAQD